MEKQDIPLYLHVSQSYIEKLRREAEKRGLTASQYAREVLYKETGRKHNGKEVQ